MKFYGTKELLLLLFTLKLASDPFLCCSAKALINSCSSELHDLEGIILAGAGPGGVSGAGGGGKGNSACASSDILKLSELGYAGNGNGLDV